MDHIRFLPRELARKYVPPKGAVLISIYDGSEEPLVAQPGWLEVLRLRFHDADDDENGQLLELFTTAHAEQVLELARRHRAQHELVVHCAAGRSRSAAVALYLSESMGLPCFKENQRVTWATWPYYNRHVYSVLRRADLQDTPWTTSD